MLDKSDLLKVLLERIRELERDHEENKVIKIKMGNGFDLVINLEESEKRNFAIIKGGED